MSTASAVQTSWENEKKETLDRVKSKAGHKTNENETGSGQVGGSRFQVCCNPSVSVNDHKTNTWKLWENEGKSRS